jgi:putrescine importer
MASANSFGYKEQLNRTLSLKDLVLFGLLFMNPIAGLTFFGLMAVVSEGNAISSYVVAFVAVIFTALSYEKMVEAFPIAGSSYSYARHALGKIAGFFAGWTMLMDYLLIPVLSTVLGSLYLQAIFPSIPLWIMMLSMVTIMTVVNIIGIEFGSKFNIAMFGVLSVAIIVFIIFSMYYVITKDHLSILGFTPIINLETFAISPVMSAASIAVLCYLGFDAITTLTEETKVAPKQIGKGIMIACLIQTLLFIILTSISMAVVKDFTLIKNPDIALSEILLTISTPMIHLIFTMTLFVAALTTALTSQTAGSRVMFAMGRDNMFPKKFFSYVHKKYKTPIYSILLIGVVNVILSFTLGLTLLSELVAFGGICGFILVNLATMVHFHKLEQRSILRTYIFPGLGAITCAYIIASMASLTLIVGFSWIVVGMIVVTIQLNLNKASVPTDEVPELVN